MSVAASRRRCGIAGLSRRIIPTQYRRHMHIIVCFNARDIASPLGTEPPRADACTDTTSGCLAPYVSWWHNLLCYRGFQRFSADRDGVVRQMA